MSYREELSLDARDIDSSNKKLAAAAVAVFLVVVIIALVIWLIVELFKSPDDDEQDGKSDAACKDASKEDSDNFKLASEQCGFGAGKVVLQNSGKYACVCGITDSSDGEAMGTTCTSSVNSSGPNGETVTFTGVPFCAANNTKQCGCGGETGEALLSGESKGKSTATDLSWCAGGGGSVSCALPASSTKCNAGVSLLGTPACSCGDKAVAKNVCASISANSTWTCGPLDLDTHKDPVVDCKCGTQSLTYVNTGYNHTCKGGDCFWTWQTSGDEPTEAYQNSMAAGTLSLTDDCSCNCTCDAGADGWTCENTYACTNDSDCVEQGLHCDSDSGLCVEHCDTSADCPAGAPTCDSTNTCTQ